MPRPCYGRCTPTCGTAAALPPRPDLRASHQVFHSARDGCPQEEPPHALPFPIAGCPASGFKWQRFASCRTSSPPPRTQWRSRPADAHGHRRHLAVPGLLDAGSLPGGQEHWPATGGERHRLGSEIKNVQAHVSRVEHETVAKFAELENKFTDTVLMPPSAHLHAQTVQQPTRHGRADSTPDPAHRPSNPKMSSGYTA